MATVPVLTSATSNKGTSQVYRERFTPWTDRHCQLSPRSLLSLGANMRIDYLSSTINAVSPTPDHHHLERPKCHDQNAYYDTTAADCSSICHRAFPATQGDDTNYNHQLDNIVDNPVVNPTFIEDFTQSGRPAWQEVPIRATSQFHGGIGHSLPPHGTDISLESRFTLSVPSPTTFFVHSPTATAVTFSSHTPHTATEIHSMYANMQRCQPAPSSIRPTMTSPIGTTEHVLNMWQADRENAEVHGTSSPTTRSYPCAWELPSSPCRVHVTGDRKSLRTHLSQVHGFVSTGRQSVRCKWDGCGRPLQKENMVRHILTHHMHIKVRCDSCGKDLCRRDVHTMHSKKFCPAKF